MTPQEEIKQKLAVIEQLRKEKEEIKERIQELSLQIIGKDITIRDLRQSIPALEQQIEQEQENKVEIKTRQQAQEILDKLLPEYSHAKEVFFKVNKARQTIKELT